MDERVCKDLHVLMPYYSALFFPLILTCQVTLMQNAFVEGSFLTMHQPFEWSDPQVNEYKQSYGQQWQSDTYQQPQYLKEENHFESPTIPDTTNLRNNSSPDTGTEQLSCKYNQFFKKKNH